MSIRLIETTTLKMKVFVGDSVPQYAILSHTWVKNEEVDYQEMNAIMSNRKHSATRKTGYSKIYDFCEKARKHGIKYGWVDTCCIDKRSSSELSEAINSMFKWYYDAEVCYAFLADLPRTGEINITMKSCRWLFRGWTLQELVAPSDLRFYDSDWKFVGSKETLKDELQAITGINEAVLTDCDARFDVPIAQRMSWASRRKTTRTEDIAYCLLGIFDVNMPLVYGEGERAFTRLQEEIIRRSNDLSIFWTSSKFKEENAVPISKVVSSGKPASYESNLNRHQASVVSYDDAGTLSYTHHQTCTYRNLFSRSPEDFQEFWGRGVYTTREQSGQVFAMTNNGVHFENAEFYHLESPARSGCYYYALYLGHSSGSLDNADMVLQKIGPGLFVRCQLSTNESGRILKRAEKENAYVIIDIRPSVRGSIESSRHHAIRFEISNGIKTQPYKNPSPITRPHPATNWNVAHQEFLTMGNEFMGYVSLRPWFVTGPEPFWYSASDSLYCYLACAFSPPARYRQGMPYLWVKLFQPDDLEIHHRRMVDEQGMRNVLQDCREAHFTMQDQLEVGDFTVKAEIEQASDSLWPSYLVRVEFTYHSRDAIEMVIR